MSAMKPNSTRASGQRGSIATAFSSLLTAANVVRRAACKADPVVEMAIDRGDIEDAAERIGSHVRVTPTLVVDARDFGLEIDATITLKLECLQHAGSFKTRGAYNRVLSNEVPPAGVITASGGNHGVAVSHVASRLGIRAEVFVTETTPEAKIARIKANGASVVIAGRYYDDAQSAMHAHAEETGALFVHPFNQPETLAGQGTVGRELERQAPELDSVLVAVGGGGLIAGVSGWYEGRARVISVEPEKIPAMSPRWPPALPSRSRSAASLPTRSAPRRSGASCSRLRRSSWRTRCSCRTRRSFERSARCGTACVCSPSPAARLRWRRCSRVSIDRSRGSASACSCAARTPTPRRCSPHRSRANNRPALAGKSHRIAVMARFRVRGTSTPTDTTVARCRPRV